MDGWIDRIVEPHVEKSEERMGQFFKERTIKDSTITEDPAKEDKGNEDNDSSTKEQFRGDVASRWPELARKELCKSRQQCAQLKQININLDELQHATEQNLADVRGLGACMSAHVDNKFAE
jgi:hypothetical protein